MKRGYLLCLVGLIGMLPVVGFAASPLDLRSCYDLALRRSATVAIADEEITAARARYLQTLGGIVPQLSLRASESLQQGVASDSIFSSSFTRTSRPEVAITLSQPLFQGLKEFQAVKISHADATRLRALEANARRLLFLDVATAFFTVGKIESDLRTLDRIIGVMRSRLTELQRRVELGKTREGERLAQATELALFEAERERQRGARQVAYEMLGFLTGMEPQPPIHVYDPSIAAVEPLDYYRAAIARRPDMQAATAAVDIAKGDAKVRRSGLLPKVDLNANYYPYRVGFQKDIHWDVQAQMTVPIFQLGAVGQVREAKVKVQQAILRATDAERIAMSDVQRLHATYQATRRQLARYRSAAMTAEQSYQHQVADFQLGLVNSLDVLQSQRSWFEAMRLRDAVHVQSWLDWTALQVSAGLLP